VPPTNRPYFRPNNPVTRGQAAKIIDIARVTVPPSPTATPVITATPDITATVIVTNTPVATATATVTGTPPTATVTSTPAVFR
jgi:hypothetical protein